MKSTHKKHRISLRQKAVASIFLVYVLLTSYFLYFTIITQHRTAEKAIINATRIKASLVSVAVSEYILNEDKTFLQGFVKHALGNRDIEYIRFTDLEGGILAEGGLQRIRMVHPEKGGPMVQEIGKPEGLLHKSGHVFNIYMPIVHEGKDVGELHMGINTMEINQRLASTAYRWITIFVVTLLTGSLLTYFLERRMRGSLKKLIQTTGHMAQGDLSQRVDIEIGDEVEKLGKSFNQMAQALAEKEKELVMASNTMVSIFNGITAGIAYISRDYVIIHANHTYEVLFKDITGSSFIKGHRCFELYLQGQNICKDCPGEYAMKAGRSRELEREIILKNGERHVLWINAYPVQDTGENPAGFVEYVMDITQQKKLEDELRTYTEHLEEIVQERTRKLKEAQVQIVHQEKMAALGQMAAGVAHEIGNPLSALSSLVQAVGVDLQKNRPDGKINLMKEQINRISRIVREMTDFSRPASYRKSLTHINQAIKSALGISRYDKRLKGIHVITSLDNDIPALKLDGDQLLQVFLNIIFNAGDAMKGKGTLTVTSRLKGKSVHVVFEDTGPGISGDMFSRIFEPFFTTKDVGEGTGLGLSVSYGIMQNMGGMIKASGGEGTGSVFTVEIPLTYLSGKTG